MHPILIQTDTLIIDSYSAFFLLAWVIGGVIFYRSFRKLGWELEQMLFVMAGCIFGAVAGAYIFNALFYGWEEIPYQIRLLAFSGKTIIGGIAGGFIGVEITKKKIGYPHSTGDAFAFAIPVGHAIGRVGCLLGGCCFGTETHLPWAVTYPLGSFPHLMQISQGLISESSLASLAVHPTQVYEILFNIVIITILWKMRPIFKVRGSLFRLYLVLYGSFRFLGEFIRGDTMLVPTPMLKPMQVALLIAVAYFSWVLYKNEFKSKTETVL